MLGKVYPRIAHKEGHQRKKIDPEITLHNKGQQQGQRKCRARMARWETICPVHVHTRYRVHLAGQHHYGPKIVRKYHPFQKLAEYGADDQAGNHRYKVIAAKKNNINKKRHPNDAVPKVGPEAEYVIEGRGIMFIDNKEGAFLAVTKQEGADQQG